MKIAKTTVALGQTIDTGEGLARAALVGWHRHHDWDLDDWRWQRQHDWDDCEATAARDFRLMLRSG